MNVFLSVFVIVERDEPRHLGFVNIAMCFSRFSISISTS